MTEPEIQIERDRLDEVKAANMQRFYEQDRRDRLEAIEREDSMRAEAKAYDAILHQREMDRDTARNAHDLAMRQAEYAHCERMAEIEAADEHDGYGPLGVLTEVLEAVGATPQDAILWWNNRNRPAAPVSSLESIRAIIESLAVIVPAILHAKDETANDGDKLADGDDVDRLLIALAAIGYGADRITASGEPTTAALRIGAATAEACDYLEKPRENWTVADFEELTEVLADLIGDGKKAAATVVSTNAPITGPNGQPVTDAMKAEILRRIGAGEKPADAIAAVCGEAVGRA